MRMSDFTQQVHNLQQEIEDFMLELTQNRYECIISIEGEMTTIKLDGDLEFIEVVLDEFENFYIDIQSPTFEYGDELLEFLEDLEF